MSLVTGQLIEMLMDQQKEIFCVFIRIEVENASSAQDMVEKVKRDAPWVHRVRDFKHTTVKESNSKIYEILLQINDKRKKQQQKKKNECRI